MFDLFDFLRICLSCNKYKQPVDIYCRDCWKIYESMSESKKEALSYNYEFPVYSLWSWYLENDNKIRRLIYALKYGHSKRANARFARMLLTKINSQIYTYKDSIFIPAPGKKHRRNHALIIANELAKLTGNKCLDLLASKSASQKFLKRYDREKIVFNLRGGIEGLSNKKIIFVDDVITSGSTARAAFLALNRPDKFEVWTLAERLCRSKKGPLERDVG